MTDYDYEPIPLVPPERMADDAMIRSATAHCEFVSQRRTARQFSEAPIDRSVIEACVLSAGSAPSGANHQPWHFVCVGDPAIKRAITKGAEEERAFYGGKADTLRLNDLKKIGTDASKPFLETAPFRFYICHACCSGFAWQSQVFGKHVYVRRSAIV